MDVKWDAGGSNSYRMGAEGKFDLALGPSHDPEKLRFAKAEMTTPQQQKNKNSATAATSSATPTTASGLAPNAEKVKVCFRKYILSPKTQNINKNANYSFFSLQCKQKYVK